ncbi:MAG: hypothetical protein J6M65_05150 [Eubacterium sp.]|nr:hypothetical protein [Eubacterium sp.]
MKTAIIYYSKHHGNTKKLLDAIKATNEIDLIDVTEGTSVELAVYDRIGIASGIYGGQFVMEGIKSILIKDTTREERIRIVNKSLEVCG